MWGLGFGVLEFSAWGSGFGVRDLERRAKDGVEDGEFLNWV